MDEPSTGLDSRSRNDLWSIIKRAKKDCTIILTSNPPFTCVPHMILIILSCTHQPITPKMLSYLRAHRMFQHIPWRRLRSCVTASASSSMETSTALEPRMRYAQSPSITKKRKFLISNKDCCSKNLSALFWQSS